MAKKPTTYSYGHNGQPIGPVTVSTYDALGRLLSTVRMESGDAPPRSPEADTPPDEPHIVE